MLGGAVRLALICNPKSGDGVDCDGIEAALARHGADVVETADGADGVAGEGVDRIACASGDGMLGRTADLAARLDVPLAVIPVGTANDFARSQGLPLDPTAAIELAATGRHLRRLELARMDDLPFVNVASTGLGPAAARRAAPLKGRLGSLAYPLGALLAGLREDPIPCTVAVGPGQLFTGRAWQVAVASTGAFGGGSQFGPVDPEDGVLDLVVIPGGPRPALLRRALGMRDGTLTRQPGVVHARGREIELRVPPETSFNVDGEVVEAGGEVRFGARAPGYALVVPEHPTTVRRG